MGVKEKIGSKDVYDGHAYAIVGVSGTNESNGKIQVMDPNNMVKYKDGDTITPPCSTQVKIGSTIVFEMSWKNFAKKHPLPKHSKKHPFPSVPSPWKYKKDKNGKKLTPPVYVNTDTKKETKICPPGVSYFQSITLGLFDWKVVSKNCDNQFSFTGQKTFDVSVSQTTDVVFEVQQTNRRREYGEYAKYPKLSLSLNEKRTYNSAMKVDRSRVLDEGKVCKVNGCVDGKRQVLSVRVACKPGVKLTVS